MGLGVFFFCALVTWSLLVCWFDANSSTVPNWLTLPAIAVAWGSCGLIAVGAVDHFGPITSGTSLWGGLGWWLFIVASGLLFRSHAAGAGDAKLAASLGVIVASVGGMLAVMAAIGFAGLFGAFTGALVRKRKSIPQGPAMICAMWVVIACATWG